MACSLYRTNPFRYSAQADYYMVGHAALRFDDAKPMPMPMPVIAAAPVLLAVWPVLWLLFLRR